MKKRLSRAQKVNEIQWEAVAQRVKDKAVVLVLMWPRSDSMAS